MLKRTGEESQKSRRPVWIRNRTEGTCEVGAGGSLGLGPAPGSHYSRLGLGGPRRRKSRPAVGTRLPWGWKEAVADENELCCVQLRPWLCKSIQCHPQLSGLLPVTCAARNIRNTHSAKLGMFLLYNYTSETFHFPKVCPHIYKYEYILKH